MYFAELEGKVVYFRLQMLSLSELERSGLPLLLLMKLGFGEGGRDPEWAVMEVAPEPISLWPCSHTSFFSRICFICTKGLMPMDLSAYLQLLPDAPGLDVEIVLFRQWNLAVKGFSVTLLVHIVRTN